MTANPTPWVTFGPRLNHVQCHHCGVHENLGYPINLQTIRQTVSGFHARHRECQGAMPYPKRIPNTPTP